MLDSRKSCEQSRREYRQANTRSMWLCTFRHLMHLGTMCVLVVLLGACRSTRQQEVSVVANSIFDSLYVPSGAVLLDRVEIHDALAYARDCTGTLIEAAYGIDRPLDDVMAEYHQQLLESGWEPYPGWDTSQTEGYAVCQKNPPTRLDFNTDLVWTSLLSQKPGKAQFTTIYTIMIIYTEPSNDDCIG
jgi:hypothetical protein